MALNDKDWLTTTLDCGDNSCLYRDRTKPGGMRTNGGCRCFRDLPPVKRIYIEKMFHYYKILLEETERQIKMVCPECKKEGRKSTVQMGEGVSTCAYYIPFFDEEGREHCHDMNITTTEYTCSNGHKWVEESSGTCWCGWSGDR